MLKQLKGQFIGNKWIQGKGKEFKSPSPFDDQSGWIGHNATPDDVDAAALAASEAFKSWSKLDITQRSAYLHTFVDILKDNKATLASLISAEIGKPNWEALTEVASMIGKLEPTEQAFRERNSESFQQTKEGTSRTKFRPHGVIAVISPYNFPGHMPNGQIMPALLAGNTIVFKPCDIATAVAEQTVEYWKEAGLPSGVLNLVIGDGSVGQLICQHPTIRGIFFTGSRNVGEHIRTSAPVDKLVALEMGGSSPLVVWDASNMEAAIFTTIQSAFITAGQRCTGARRLIIPSNNFGQEFLLKLINSTRQIRIGRFDERPEPYMGPLRLPRMVDQLLAIQEGMISQGAIPLLKSERLSLGNSFISPGILDVTEENPREDEEIFGPLLQVIRVKDFDSALLEANNTKYGLAAGIFTEDASLYHKFQNEIQAGIINWNRQLTGASPYTPFGGIKQSGNYRPSGFLATDYCVYSTGSIELEQLTLPPELPPGITLT